MNKYFVSLFLCGAMGLNGAAFGEFEHCEKSDAKCVGQVLLDAIQSSNPSSAPRLLSGTYMDTKGAFTRTVVTVYEGKKLIQIIESGLNYVCDNNIHCSYGSGYHLNVLTSRSYETRYGTISNTWVLQE